MAAYYNEHDPKAAAWLRELIKAGLIAPGEVDERSIEDVVPNELNGFTQCHFFAGIGVWSYALRLAGWPDDRPVWTGSCPCQPFSAAGKRGGTADERHLWPAFQFLIEQCRPAIVLGEQVASKDGLAWLDTVRADLEASGYAVGAADLCAAGVGAPHIRQRLWFVGKRGAERLVGNADRAEREARGVQPIGAGTRSERVAQSGASGGLADTDDARLEGWQRAAERADQQPVGAGSVGGGPGPTNGHWRTADWLHCRDGKWRPVEPGTFPLVHGASERVGRLRGYGNAVVAQAAQAFIESVM
jgi:DNA (cytosine-5)-methyltransferase 1